MSTTIPSPAATAVTPLRHAPGRFALAMAVAVVLAGVALVGLFATPAEASGHQDEKCITYYFLYTDGTDDAGTICDSPSTPGMNIYAETHGINVPRLHISCSDDFSTAVFDGDVLLGFDSESGQSDLGGRLIAADADGVGQWGIRKSWTGGDDCGAVDPPAPAPVPDPEVDCAGTVIIEVREVVSGLLVPGAGASLDGADAGLSGGTATATDLDCGDYPVVLTTIPEGYVLADGETTTKQASIPDDGDSDTVVFWLALAPGGLNGDDLIVPADPVITSPVTAPAAPDVDDPAEPDAAPEVEEEEVLDEEAVAPPAVDDEPVTEAAPAADSDTIAAADELPRTGLDAVALAWLAVLLLLTGATVLLGLRQYERSAVVA